MNKIPMRNLVNINKLIKRTTFILLLILIQTPTYGQENPGKLFFPTQEKLQWLVNILGQEHSKKDVRTFKKNFKARFKRDFEYEENDQLRTYTKSGMIYYVNIASDEPHTNTECLIASDMHTVGIPFMGSPKLKELEQIFMKSKDFTITYVYNENGGGRIEALHHPSKLFLNIQFSGSKKYIVSTEFSKSSYKYENTQIARRALAARTKNKYVEKGFQVDPADVMEIGSNLNYVQIGNILYSGSLKDGVPHGKGKWGVFNSKDPPSFFNGNKFSIIAEGKFDMGKPAGEHNFKRNGKKMIYRYNDEGKAYLLKYYNSDQSISLNAKGEASSANAKKYSTGKYRNGKYFGGINANGQPNDEKGRLVIDQYTEVVTHFVNGRPKNGAKATFTYSKYSKYKATVETTINSSLEMNGATKVTMEDTFEGTIYLKNGKADPYKDGEIRFKKLRFTDDLNGAAVFKGKIELLDALNNLFKGKNLEFSFEAYPDAKFKGDITVISGKVVPVGWHTVTEYLDGVAQGSLKGKYAPSGEFLDGQNLYQTPEAFVYKRGTYKDPRDGKVYNTATFVRREYTDRGNLITWLLEDIDYHPITDEVWKFTRSRRSIKKAYYDLNTVKRACPPGWRLPNGRDIDEFKRVNTSKDEFHNLIRKVGLEKNGYIYKLYRETEMRRREKETIMWIQGGRYISSNEFNKVQTVSDIGMIRNKFFTCRCVKDSSF